MSRRWSWTLAWLGVACGGGRGGEALPPGDATADVAWDDATSADDGSSADAAPSDVPWRSALYPEGWTPSFTVDGDAFVHDFSYAGYHHGEAELGAFGPSTTYDVVAAFGADPTGGKDATAAIQAAIDAASIGGGGVGGGGGVVVLPAGLYRLDGVLTVKRERVVLRGAGSGLTRLYFTRSKDMGFRAHVTFAGALSSDLEVPLAVDGRTREAEVLVADPGALAVGDEVAVGWVVTPEFIAEHQMTGTWTNDAFHDRWQTFFRRTVKAIDRAAKPARITLDVPLRYPAKVRDQASLRRERGYLREVGVEGLALSNAMPLADAWAQNQTGVLRFERVADGWIRDVRSFPSPAAPTTGPGAGAHLASCGIGVFESKRVTVADSRLELAENKGGGGNGYLFEVRQSSEVLFRDLFARRGRHNFIQNWGFGTTGCVWLRVHSEDSLQEANLATAGLGVTCYSDFHHSLATANLVDQSSFDDGMKVVNRGSESTYAGITGTQNVFWNTSGKGFLHSMQFARGYVVGTRELTVVLRNEGFACLGLPACYEGTAPDDWLEGAGRGATLAPQSLYEDQRARRLGK